MDSEKRTYYTEVSLRGVKIAQGSKIKYESNGMLLFDSCVVGLCSCGRGGVCGCGGGGVCGHGCDRDRDVCGGYRGRGDRSRGGSDAC